MSSGRLSANVWNDITDEILKRYDDLVKMLVDEMLASGNPPFTQRITPRQQYDKLVAMRQSGDPDFWNDPSAQSALQKLSLQFGAPPPMGGI